MVIRVKVTTWDGASGDRRLRLGSVNWREVHPDRPDPDPVSCLLLDQLATDLGWAGRGIGTGLVRHALQRCVTVAALAGGRDLLVNDADMKAAAFWRGRGFLPSRQHPAFGHTAAGARWIGA
jgi:GNAT superfamily N-acetyltransferase